MTQRCSRLISNTSSKARGKPYGQYRNAVASGESQNADNCLILETHPMLPRSGTDRSRIADLPLYLLWLEIRPKTPPQSHGEHRDRTEEFLKAGLRRG